MGQISVTPEVAGSSPVTRAIFFRKMNPLSISNYLEILRFRCGVPRGYQIFAYWSGDNFSGVFTSERSSDELASDLFTVLQRIAAMPPMSEWKRGMEARDS